MKTNKQVNVTLQGDDDFMLSFAMPKEAKAKLVKGLKYFEQVGGFSENMLTFDTYNENMMDIF